MAERIVSVDKTEAAKRVNARELLKGSRAREEFIRIVIGERKRRKRKGLDTGIQIVKE